MEVALPTEEPPCPASGGDHASGYVKGHWRCWRCGYHGCHPGDCQPDRPVIDMDNPYF